MKLAIATSVGAALLSLALIAVYVHEGVPAQLAIAGPVVGLMAGLLITAIMDEVI